MSIGRRRNSAESCILVLEGRMPIINRLSTIMGTRRITQSELQRQTGLHYTTINDLYHDRAKRLDVDTLEKLCRALGVGVGDILEYQPGDALYRCMACGWEWLAEKEPQPVICPHCQASYEPRDRRPK